MKDILVPSLQGGEFSSTIYVAKQKYRLGLSLQQLDTSVFEIHPSTSFENSHEEYVGWLRNNNIAHCVWKNINNLS